MVGDALGLDRLEGAGTHMERHVGTLHAQGIEPLQHGLVEVQGRRGGSHGTGLACEHGLVAALILFVVGVGDVGRQGHMAVAGHERVGVVAESEAEDGAVFMGPAAEQGGGEATVHVQHGAGCGLLAHLHVGGHGVRLARLQQHPLHQEFESSAARLAAIEAGLDHLGVVEDHEIACPQQAGQVTELTIHRLLARAVEQARAAALGSGVLGNELRRKVEIVVAEGMGGIGAHGRQTDAGKGASLPRAAPPQHMASHAARCGAGAVFAHRADHGRMPDAAAVDAEAAEAGDAGGAMAGPTVKWTCTSVWPRRALNQSMMRWRSASRRGASVRTSSA